MNATGSKRLQVGREQRWRFKEHCLRKCLYTHLSTDASNMLNDFRRPSSCPRTTAAALTHNVTPHGRAPRTTFANSALLHDSRRRGSRSMRLRWTPTPLDWDARDRRHGVTATHCNGDRPGLRDDSMLYLSRLRSDGFGAQMLSLFARSRWWYMEWR